MKLKCDECRHEIQGRGHEEYGDFFASIWCDECFEKRSQQMNGQAANKQVKDMEIKKESEWIDRIVQGQLKSMARGRAEFLEKELKWVDGLGDKKHYGCDEETGEMVDRLCTIIRVLVTEWRKNREG